MRHASAEGPGFKTHCPLLTTGPLCHRSASTCLKTESETDAVIAATISPPGRQARRVTNLAIFYVLFVRPDLI